MKASTIFRIVSAGLQDMDADNPKRWKWEKGTGQNDIGLLDYLNAAINEIAMQRPDCYAVTESVQLTAGVKQNLPSGAVMLCELIRNMGTNGTTPGKPILLSNQQVTFSWYNPHNPMTRVWDQENTSRIYEVDNYMYDRTTNPNIYFVFPPVPSGSKKYYVECTYYALPPEVTSVDGNIPISAGYAQAIGHHILASIFEADNEYGVDEKKGMSRADYHYTMFKNCMAVKLQVDTKMPRANNSLR